MLLRLGTQWADATTLRLGAQWQAEIQIHDDFERSSINAALSEVTTDTDDVLLIKLHNRLQAVTEHTDAQGRWLEPFGKISGVLGLQPRIELVPYRNGFNNNGANHQQWDWQMRGHYSYDGETWMPFDTVAAVDRLRWRNNAPFTEDTVWISRSWPFSLTQYGNWITALKAAHPTKIQPSISASAFTPVGATTFPAQDYIAGEVAAKTDELGRAVPVTPFYAFEINDAAYAPTKYALIVSGVHAGEDVGEIVFREFIDWLLGSDAAAVALRQQFRITVYPVINPAGRWAGYWRAAPGSDSDTNRDYARVEPHHESTVIMKNLTVLDANGQEIQWGLDIHAAPSGSRMQVGARNLVPSTVAFFDAAQARYPAGAWSVYGSQAASPPWLTNNIKYWWWNSLGAVCPLLLETSDRTGPISPANMRPYAEAMGGALYDLDESGWFGVGPPTLSAPTVTAITATSATPRVTLTNAASGTLHYAVYPSAASQPTFNGTVWSGTPIATGSEASNTVDGVQTFASAATGLDGATPYRIAFAWADGVTTSAVAWSESWVRVTDTDRLTQDAALMRSHFVRISHPYYAARIKDEQHFVRLTKQSGVVSVR